MVRSRSCATALGTSARGERPGAGNRRSACHRLGSGRLLRSFLRSLFSSRLLSSCLLCCRLLGCFFSGWLLRGCLLCCGLLGCFFSGWLLRGCLLCCRLLGCFFSCRLLRGCLLCCRLLGCFFSCRLLRGCLLCCGLCRCLRGGLLYFRLSGLRLFRLLLRCCHCFSPSCRHGRQSHGEIRAPWLEPFICARKKGRRSENDSPLPSNANEYGRDRPCRGAKPGNAWVGRCGSAIPN